MTSSFKVNETITPTVDSDRQIFGQPSGFKCAYVNKATGTVTAVPTAFTEITATVAGNSSPANGLIAAGSAIITVDDGTQFADGDTIKDANENYYYILSIDGNDLHLRSTTVADIADNDTITQVGNTGLYTVNFAIDTVGEYIVYINNPSLNMQNESFSVSIVAETLTDAQTKLDNITDQLGITSSRVRFRAFA